MISKPSCKVKKSGSGFTLVELLTVVSVILVLAALGLPAVRQVLDSFESSLSVRHVISTAITNARAIAARQQAYAGLRFQQDLNGNQYMIFIVNDPDIGPWWPGRLGCRAVAGYQPMKLPTNVGVMDLYRVQRDYNPNNHQTDLIGEMLILSDNMIANQSDLTDITTFSIIFSSTGKMVIHEVRVRNRDGFVDSANNTNISYDDVFNKKDQVDQKDKGIDRYAVPPGAGMFYQDDYFDLDLNVYGDLGLGPELSRRSFIIYEKDKFRQIYGDGDASTDYLAQMARNMIYINSYTGTMILPD